MNGIVQERVMYPFFAISVQFTPNKSQAWTPTGPKRTVIDYTVPNHDI